MLLAALLFVSGASAATPAPATVGLVPGAFAKIAVEIRNEKSRSRRLALLGGLMAEVRRRVDSLPDDIPEGELPRVQALYEMNILFGTLRMGELNPASCPIALRGIRQMTNPSGGEDSEGSLTGRLVLDVVRSVCAP